METQQQQHPSPNNMMMKMCVVCGKSDGDCKRCSRCKIPHYCSRECQAQDWPRHKLACCVDKAEQLNAWNKDSSAHRKEVKQAMKRGTVDDLLTKHYPTPKGSDVPPNFFLKQEANLHYQKGPSKDNEKLGNLRGEQHYRAYYDDIIEHQEVWMNFFSKPENHNDLNHTVGILGTLAVVYRQRGSYSDCEKVLDLAEKELFPLFERNAISSNDAIDLYTYRTFRCKHQHVRYNMYFEQKKYNENVKLYRDLMDYELTQNIPLDNQMYLKMVPISLNKKPSIHVVESLTDDEIMKMVLAPLTRGIPKDFAEGKARVTLQTCENCSTTEESLTKQYKVCERCEIVYYCSRQCQKEHWKTHKKVCKKTRG
mgnify:CR=1 FL=1